MQYQVIESEAGKSVSAVLDGRLYAANGDHPNYNAIVEGLRNGEDVTDLFDASATVARKFKALTERVSVANGRIYLDNEPQDNALTRQVVRFLQADEDFGPLVKFYEKVQQNPVKHSRDQLYSWLRDRDFSITADGDFIAYKGLRSDRTSIHAGPGIVNGQEQSGHLPNEDGSVVEVARSYVTADPSDGCSQGLHAGTWEYASGFGQRVVEVRINPRDVVSVPTDCEAQKLRTCRYTVVKEVEAADTSALRTYEDDDESDDWSDEVYDVYAVASDSKPGEFYEVTEYTDGRLECECPSFQFAGNGRCKHTDRV